MGESRNATSDETLKSTCTVSCNNKVLHLLPKMVAIRSFTCNHIYHYCGQLRVYLRLHNIPGAANV